MAVKVTYNAFLSDDSRLEKTFDANIVCPDPEAPNQWRLEKSGSGRSFVAYVPQDVILAIEIVADEK